MTKVRRWAPWALLLAIAIGGLTIGLHRTDHPSLNAQVMHIAGEVRCPVCNGETVAQSGAAVSVDIRNQIRSELQAHETPNQILAGLVRSYGPGILEKPQPSGIGLLVWVVPVIIAAGGIVALVLAFSRWRSRPYVDAPADVSDAPPAPDAGAPAVALERPPKQWPRWAVMGLGAAMITGGACWALVAATTTRLPGQSITGQALGPQAIANDLQQAQQDSAKGNPVAAIKEYQTVLASDPTQPEALTGEGWLLAQTQQPSLLQQGLGLLSSAERADPTYAPAHVYRGIALLSEDDYADSIPELQWYLGHDPDPQLAAKVRSALAEAQKAVAAGAH